MSNTPRTDAFFNPRTVGELEWLTYNSVARGLLELCRQLERESAPRPEERPIDESRFEEIELWVGEYGHFRKSKEDYKAREVFKRIRAAIRRLAASSPQKATG